MSILYIVNWPFAMIYSAFFRNIIDNILFLELKVASIFFIAQYFHDCGSRPADFTKTVFDTFFS